METKIVQLKDLKNKDIIKWLYSQTRMIKSISYKGIHRSLKIPFYEIQFYDGIPTTAFDNSVFSKIVENEI